MDSLTEFWTRLRAEWLPTFCEARGYRTDSFAEGKVVSERDAADFLRALSFVFVNDRGEFTMPRSKAKEVIFWDGHFADPKIRMSLWIEPVVTIAAVARLHLDYGWPVECLGMQSANWAFDLTAFLPDEPENEHIAGEVKATSRELDALMKSLASCCAQGMHDCTGGKAGQVNAHKKWSGLIRSRAPVFWALGPNNDNRVYRVAYESDGRITLTQGVEVDLRFPG